MKRQRKTDLRIKEIAKERGLTLGFIAKKLGIYRSNMSGIASGRRGMSLGLLEKISRILACGIDELIMPDERAAVFKDKKLELRVAAIERRNYDGVDKTWVDRVMLAQIAHYRAMRRIK